MPGSCGPVSLCWNSTSFTGFPLAECVHERQVVEQYATRHSKNPK
jgi:hypothetical protein